MKLLVRVIEAKNIPAMDQNGFSDPYVKLQLGKQKFKTKVVKKCLNPSWCEEFTFRVEDLKEEIVISVLDEDKYFNDDFVGQIKVPVTQVFDACDKSLGTAWYTLQPKNKKAKNRDCGEILLTVCFAQSKALLDPQNSCDRSLLSKKYVDAPVGTTSSSSSGPTKLEESATLNTQSLAGRIAQMFNMNGDAIGSTSIKGLDASGSPENDNPEVEGSSSEELASSINFTEVLKHMETRDQGDENPNNLTGGVLLDQLYAISPPEMNGLLFSSDSDFLKSLADFQGSTDLQIGAWKFENECLKRVISFTKAASKLVKALKTIEEQEYLKADGKVFAILCTANTPDAPYGNCFKTEVLYCIMTGPELPSGEPSSRLVISWRMNFVQSTIMKGMIEGGARQGIKESFEQYANVLSQNAKPVDMKDISSEKEQLLSSLQVEPQSDRKLAVLYFANFTVVSSVLMALYLLVHIWLSKPSTIQGLEFVGLDLPDTIGEVIVCTVLALQGQRVLELISRFRQARMQTGSDHGVKAVGDGWLLTVALIEGKNLAAHSSGLADPYVVFTCNGKTRTSSIKFRKSDPVWNEIFEFDAADEPPSTLDIEIYDFDGPYDEARSLGHAEINFVKTDLSDLADVWVPLRGKLAQACQSKLHLRIFLNNTRGSNVVKDYLTKMEKEVGKKLRLRSPQTNSAFQKLFKLPPEEFLINDFTCHLKRKMPLQGRLFLSARIIGFHADLFGHKTKFFFLWEDIEDIQVVNPKFSSMGSPSVVMTLRPGRGLDARHGAKTQDAEGRLKFYFHSFVSFGVAQRTIMALWKARALSLEQKVQIVEEESESKSLQIVDDETKSLQIEEESECKSSQSEENGSVLGVEDVGMSIVYSSVLAIPTTFFMEIFNGNELDRRIMERGGCLNYSHSPWESENADKPDACQRQIYYKFDRNIIRHNGELTSTQQKLQLPDRNGWLVEEVMTIHGVPFSDYFNLHLRYQVEDAPLRSVGCNVQVFFGVAWLKSTKHRKKITKDILLNLQERLMVIFSILEKEFASGK